MVLKNINLTITEGEILVICGKNGSGKSTLLKCMKKEIMPAGHVSGKIENTLKSYETAIVFQDPDIQMVNQVVIENLLFQMENMGFNKDVINKNIAETVSFFGLEYLLHKDISELSGGQKQLIALCAALMVKPKLILLDEPTAQLDPIASLEILNTILKINEELNISFIISEHKLDDIIEYAHRVVIMDKGNIIHNGNPKEVFKFIHETEDKNAMYFIPDIPMLCLKLNMKHICFTPREFKKAVKQDKIKISPYTKSEKENNKDITLISMKNIFYAYKKSTDFVIKNLTFNIKKGEKICIIAGNATGKTTLLKLLTKIISPIHGKINMSNNKIAYIPQDIKNYFRYETVAEELKIKTDCKVDNMLLQAFNVVHLLQHHPYDLSSGEAQKVVLISVLLSKPEIIIMDEPTKNLDPYAKYHLSKLLSQLETTLIIATHDLNFAATIATRCVMLFDGAISLDTDAQDFFSDNQYYTTTINRALRHIYPNIMTIGQVLLSP